MYFNMKQEETTRMIKEDISNIGIKKRNEIRNKKIKKKV